MAKGLFLFEITDLDNFHDTEKGGSESEMFEIDLLDF